MPPTPVAKAFALLILAAAPSLASSAESAISIPGWGTLLLETPGTWRQEGSKGEPILTVAFLPASGQSFRVMVSPMVVPRTPCPQQPAKAGAPCAKPPLTAKSASSPVVGAGVVTHDFPPGAVEGTYFSANENASKYGQYKYMTQGVAFIEELAIAFIIVSNEDSRSVVAPALRMLQSAHKR